MRDAVPLIAQCLDRWIDDPAIDAVEIVSIDPTSGQTLIRIIGGDTEGEPGEQRVVARQAQPAQGILQGFAWRHGFFQRRQEFVETRRLVGLHATQVAQAAGHQHPRLEVQVGGLGHRGAQGVQQLRQRQDSKSVRSQDEALHQPPQRGGRQVGALRDEEGVARLGPGGVAGGDGKFAQQQLARGAVLQPGTRQGFEQHPAVGGGDLRAPEGFDEPGDLPAFRARGRRGCR